MSLASVQEIICRKWTDLSMTNKVIDCVHSLARRNPCGIIFSNCNGQPLSHDDAFTGSYDNTYLPSETDDDDADYPYDNIEHGGNTAPPI